ncbi:MAG: diguanylate cyclase [Magnetococcales bacterium]|nr:diguanylate cyclase [Magnetococcales bacterium]MBF0151450.1 diguanylate cyclase [Magnetococcales bacterium]MBF0174415.1 diguanylate cyclase [Magnetococcales bacterium]MBF0348428.1 diguanylate cyclase [Magnetococcales bacterium]MBF0632464.1 diguanylate cyclase [Magnetococcales bacterium]
MLNDRLRADSDHKAKILIVDDEKINIDILDGLLKPFYKTVVAKDGSQALKRLEKPPLPDLILLDVVMPGMDGYEVCRRVKNNLLTREIPIIFVTGQAEERHEALGFQVGAVDYISKPLSPLITLARVKNHVELKRRGDMLEQMAVLDALTGIANRRRFNEFLEYEWERSLRYRHPLSLILMDIDFFKRYNDHFGHAKGDECLVKVARAIAEAMPRTVDLACRYGGEEFACILPETHVDGAGIVAHRILANCRNLHLPHPRSDAGELVTLSLGTSTLIPAHDVCREDLIEMADRALYWAKNHGRNQVGQYSSGGA